MMNRLACLNALLSLRLSPSEAARELAAFPWDSEPMVEVHRHHVLAVLQGYIAGTYTANVVEQWAELLEGRDDVGFERERSDLLLRIIFELANPELEGALTPNRARELVAALGDR